jgi:hypothetical protein
MRIVVKVGTRTLSAGGDCLSRPRMVDLVRQIAHLHAEGHELLLVSSGAIFAGREALGAPPRRKDIPFKQTLAAVGQVRLMAIYEQLFGLYDTRIAQALLTRADLADRERYLNARNTMLSLLRLGVVPVINENDVVGVEEIRIGDNDNLSALVANLVEADLLVMLTDLPGLFTADPRVDPEAELIREVASIDDWRGGAAPPWAPAEPQPRLRRPRWRRALVRWRSSRRATSRTCCCGWWAENHWAPVSCPSSAASRAASGGSWPSRRVARSAWTRARQRHCSGGAKACWRWA